MKSGRELFYKQSIGGIHLSVTDVLDCYVDPRFHPLDNARSERAQKKIPLRNNLRGIIEVPGGFEPPYTVLQTAD